MWVCVPSHWPGFPRRGLGQEAAATASRVHLMLDDGSLRIHFILSGRETVDATDPVQGLGELADLLKERIGHHADIIICDGMFLNLKLLTQSTKMIIMSHHSFMLNTN